MSSSFWGLGELCFTFFLFFLKRKSLDFKCNAVLYRIDDLDHVTCCVGRRADCIDRCLHFFEVLKKKKCWRSNPLKVQRVEWIRVDGSKSITTLRRLGDLFQTGLGVGSLFCPPRYGERKDIKVVCGNTHPKCVWPQLLRITRACWFATKSSRAQSSSQSLAVCHSLMGHVLNINTNCWMKEGAITLVKCQRKTCYSPLIWLCANSSRYHEFNISKLDDFRGRIHGCYHHLSM